MKLSKTILILAFLAVSSFGISTAVSAQDKDDTAKATEAFDKAVQKAINSEIILGVFNFNTINVFNPDEVLKENDTALDYIIIESDSLVNNFETTAKSQGENSRK